MKTPNKGPSISVLTDPPILCLNLLSESLTLEGLLPQARHSEVPPCGTVSPVDSDHRKTSDVLF